MKSSRLIALLWTVVGVLLIGGGVVVFLLVHKTDSLQDKNTELTGNNDSLHEQIRQLKASPTPSVSALPDAAGHPIISPTPTPTTAATPAPKAATPTPLKR